MKQAVCVLVPVGDKFSFLSISRRNDNTQWGIPGGKVDDGESKIDAAIREIFEETSLELDSENLQEIFTDICPGEVDFLVTTFLYTGEQINISDLKPEDGFELAIMDRTDLSNSTISPFAGYNSNVFVRLNGIYQTKLLFDL